MISVKQVFNDGAVLLSPTTSGHEVVSAYPCGREARQEERDSEGFSLQWRQGRNLLGAVAFLCKMFRTLPFNQQLLNVHEKFIKQVQVEIHQQQKILKEHVSVQQWEPPSPYYGDDPKPEDDVEVTLEMTCSLASAACAITSAEHGLLPLDEVPVWGEGGRVRHFKETNRAMQAVRLMYSRDVAEGKTGRTGTLQFPIEREVLSATELIRKSRGASKCIPIYDVCVSILQKHCDRFAYAGWVHNLADASGIHSTHILPLKDGKYRRIE